MMIWTHAIDPIALDFGVMQVHWYGVMYLIAFGSAWMLGRYRARLPGSCWNEKQLSDLIFYGAVGVILGGRAGYVLFYHFDYFLSDPLWLFAVWEGGMSFHGGLLGVVAMIIWFSKKEQKSLLELGDFVAPLVPMGLCAGRIGNFIGGELWGRPTDQSWGVIFPRAADQLARHPSQLYQAALEGFVLFIILWWFSSKPRQPGAVAGLFLVGYGVARSLIEFFREPDAHLGLIGFDLLSMGQLLSLPMVILGLWMMLRGQRKV